MSTESTTEGDPIVTSKRQDDGIRVISNVLSHCVINAKDPSNGFNFSKEAANIIINSDGDGNGEANCDGDAYGPKVKGDGKLTFRPADVFYNFANVNYNGDDANCDGDGNGLKVIGDGDGNRSGSGLAIGEGVGNGISKLNCTRKVCHCDAFGPTTLMCERSTEQPWKCPFRPTWSNTPIHKIGWAKKAKNSPYVSDDYKNGYFSGDMFEVSTEGCSCRFVHLAPIRSHGGGGKIAGYSRYGCREDCEGIKIVMLTDRMYNSQYN